MSAVFASLRNGVVVSAYKYRPPTAADGLIWDPTTLRLIFGPELAVELMGLLTVERRGLMGAARGP
jgi:hypothetical protein